MDDQLWCHDLLEQCEQVATFVRALLSVAGRCHWLDVEPYAEEAWREISQRQGLPWVEIREFVREAWLGATCPGA
jgi:hypothetical protein